ncbi:SMI1/KNR4 family protein [Sediminicola luteus]|uniref:Knr4/Smi1-like domain-containing protein n=1 Tax=Sediminicola luteus TaxID=319238 RepID=A0A2A4G346_9FLAO|nr:SMI1/KNR4 family protein [Sediminicola luteus]PCE62851.1 hypothetical protein B7P33_16355 [Sediminicola luteus]
MGERSFKLIESTIEDTFSNAFKEILKKYAGLSIEEDWFNDNKGTTWKLAAFTDFTSMHNLTKEFREKGWGVKVPFANDPGGWHYCLSFDEDTYGKVIVNRWTDHEEKDQFLVIAESFEEFIDGLKRRPEENT